MRTRAPRRQKKGICDRVAEWETVRAETKGSAAIVDSACNRAMIGEYSLGGEDSKINAIIASQVEDDDDDAAMG